MRVASSAVLGDGRRSSLSESNSSLYYCNKGSLGSWERISKNPERGLTTDELPTSEPKTAVFGMNNNRGVARSDEVVADVVKTLMLQVITCIDSPSQFYTDFAMESRSPHHFDFG
jgi:hypothetical protein